jgi:hypothetical protein
MFPSYSLVCGLSRLFRQHGYGGNKCIFDIHWLATPLGLQLRLGCRRALVGVKGEVVVWRPVVTLSGAKSLLEESNCRRGDTDTAARLQQQAEQFIGGSFGKSARRLSLGGSCWEAAKRECHD